MSATTLNSLIQNLLDGDNGALARVISLIENKHQNINKLLQEIHRYTGKAYRVGITGPPGAGKSTITDKLALEARKKGLSVGVIAVDPTSPFTGGAILGDRIRMTHAASDPGIFIRSMATRGSLGGIARATRYAADAMDASGKDIVFIETVGVGQSELDIFYTVDTVIVVVVPESGSGIQVMKAGLMEIAHCFVVNKADRPGAELIQQEIEDMLMLAPPGAWEVKVILTQGNKGTGINVLFDELERHKHYLETGKLQQCRTIQNHHLLCATVLDLLKEKIFEKSEDISDLASKLAQKITNREIDPVSAANQVVNIYLGKKQSIL